MARIVLLIVVFLGIFGIGYGGPYPYVQLAYAGEYAYPLVDIVIVNDDYLIIIEGRAPLRFHQYEIADIRIDIRRGIQRPLVEFSANRIGEEQNIRLVFRSTEEAAVFTQKLQKLPRNKKDGCFIATAAYGTPLHEDINILRRFRDEKLKKNEAGKVFVENYYKFSPWVAEKISESEALRTVVRVGFVKPLVSMVKFIYYKE